MTREEFKAKVSMAYGGRDTWEEFLEVVWQLHLEASNHWIPVEEELPRWAKVVNGIGGIKMLNGGAIHQRKSDYEQKRT